MRHRIVSDALPTTPILVFCPLTQRSFYSPLYPWNLYKAERTGIKPGCIHISCHRVINMEKNQWKTYAFWILFTEGVGLLAGWLTRNGTALYRTTMNRPALSPPAIVFPIVWTLLYALMGIGAARVYLTRPSENRSDSLRLYMIQLFFNLFWSIIFFNFRAYFIAFLWLIALWVLILRMIGLFRRVDPLAAGLQIPYLVWVTFAGYLNAGVWLLNP